MSDKTKSYKVSESSLKRAQELFGLINKEVDKKTDKKSEKKRLKRKRDKKKSEKISQFCTATPLNIRKKFTALAFSPGFSLFEMRSCLMRHDWISLQRLFPLLLELPSDRETLLWRYAFTIFTHSPMSNEAHLQEFLHSCVGCQNDNPNDVLDKFLALRLDS